MGVSGARHRAPGGVFRGARRVRASSFCEPLLVTMSLRGSALLSDMGDPPASVCDATHLLLSSRYSGRHECDGLSREFGNALGRCKDMMCRGQWTTRRVLTARIGVVEIEMFEMKKTGTEKRRRQQYRVTGVSIAPSAFLDFRAFPRPMLWGQLRALIAHRDIRR